MKDVKLSYEVEGDADGRYRTYKSNKNKNEFKIEINEIPTSKNINDYLERKQWEGRSPVRSNESFFNATSSFPKLYGFR